MAGFPPSFLSIPNYSLALVLTTFRSFRPLFFHTAMSHKTSAAVSSDFHPPVGTLIDGGSLELVEILGVGGYGVVYRAVDTCSLTPKLYAVKCLVAQAHQTSRQRQIHIREIALHQIASSHPGVVTLHRVVEEFNRTYIIMDYAPDHDLFTQILHNCRYLGDDALIKHVFLQLLDAVEYCHSLGIYHRDLKPENVLCFDDGLRVAITDFGLATTEKLSTEFRTGSVYHMSPECQGGEFALTGNYSPMFNDIWSLGIILLNLATGRNPWKSATPDDQTFRAYLRDPLNFLPTVLPISSEINDILTQMLEVDWRERITLRDLRHAIEDVETFYSDGAIFEGSMARCLWEAGMDIDNESSVDEPQANLPPSKSESIDFISHWSKDSTSTSDIVFAKHDSTDSLTNDPSYGLHWTVFSSSGATKAFESESSSVVWPERTLTPVSPVSSGTPSLLETPNSLDTRFSDKDVAHPRKCLTIDTNLAQQARFYDPTASIATSLSNGTSIMQTAVEFDPYSSSFFGNAVFESESRGLPVSMEASFDDEEMTSPSIWVSSVTEMSSPSIYSSSSADSGEMAFTRSKTPSPAAEWHEYRSQVQCITHSPPSQLPFSVYTTVTDVSPSSRPPVFSVVDSKAPYDGSTRPKTAGIFNSVKFFSCPSSPAPPSTHSAALPSGRRCIPMEAHTTHSGDQAPAAPPFQGIRTNVPTQTNQHRSAPIPILLHQQNQRGTERIRPPRHWFMSSKFFSHVGAQ
ncbi:hypothetical protein H2248_003896 [Termitomyces sp. 'cryptogamus']|nr:hypothetical protein H2248_003896 [Termitomyces sp. 'cryptogamus']